MIKNRFNLRNVVAMSICLAGMTMFSGCDPEENKPPAILVADDSSLTQEVFADSKQGKSGVSFTTTGAWTSNISIVTSSSKMIAVTNSTDWISISPNYGTTAGNYTIEITIKLNDTGEDRTAIITIFCNGEEVKIIVTQKGIAENGETPTPSVKLVNRIEIYNDYRINTGAYEFQYDMQNKMTKIVTNNGTSIISYPNSNTIVISNEDNTMIFALNKDGSIASMQKDGYEHTLEYVNGYLQKIEYAFLQDMNGDVIIDDGIYTNTHTWEDENIKKSVVEFIAPTLSDIFIYTYNYSTILNKPCGIDIGRILMWGEIFPPQWFGKSTINLPSSIITQYNDQEWGTTNYRYEIDSDGYVLKIFSQGFYFWGEPIREEQLYCIISYQ